MEPAPNPPASSTCMEAAFGRLHTTYPILKAANIAMQPTPTEGHILTEGPMPKMLPVGAGVLSRFLK